MKHSPLIRLQAASNAYVAAQHACPHWDEESNDSGHECCYQLDEAQREFRLARNACKESMS